MPKSPLSLTGNLMEYYDLGFDDYYVVNDHDFLCQTFTPTVPHDLLFTTLLFKVDGRPRRVRGELKRTDLNGKPTGPVQDYFEIIPSEAHMLTFNYTAFLWHIWQDLDVGTKYAVVISYPDADLLNYMKVGADTSSATFASGELLTSDNAGATWTAHPTEDILFKNWGFTPIPHPKPPPAITNWLLTDLTWEVYPDGFILTATTNVLCHLWMRYTTVEPQQHKIPREIRGIALPSDKRYCFVAFTDNEQEEKGDTLIHTFIKTPWPICETRWFYFYGTRGDIMIPSTSPIFKLHREEKDVTDYVISLGKFGEVPHLHGDVKLKAGTNVTITRVDTDNALEIATTAGQGFGNSWQWYASNGIALPVGTFSYDYMIHMVNALNQDYRLYTPPQWPLSLSEFQRLELRAVRTTPVAYNPEIRIGIMMNQPNIIGNPYAEGMYFQIGMEYVYGVTANGSARTSTQLILNDFILPKWLRIDRKTASVEFYWNGVLKATHTTNLPSATKTCIFVFQMKGIDNQPRGFAITHPKFNFC